MMQTKGFETILGKHPFFKDMVAEHLAELSSCASNVKFNAETMIFRQNESAEKFYLIRGGKVAVEVRSADLGPITIQTLTEGDVLGWSWLFPPYLWNFDARAVEETRAIALDARCLRGKCEHDSALGYDLMKRFSQIAIERMQAQRLQLLDMFRSG